MKMNGADAVLRSLEAEGVDIVFGIPGGAILPIYDAIARGTTRASRARAPRAGGGAHGRGLRARVRPGRRRLRHVRPGRDQPRHADRRRVDGLDAARLHHRPGAQPPDRHRRLPGVRHHRRDHADRQALVARPGRRGDPARASRPRSTSPAPAAAARCSSTSRATSRRRRSTSRTRTRSTCPAGGRRRRGHPRQIAEAARRIAAAEKPVLYVGGGTLNADACAELLELAEAGRLPVVTTLMAKSAFPETHELHFGWPGMHGPKWSNLAMNKCDLLVSVGARFDDRVTGKLAAFAPGATVIHLDIDAAEIDKLRRADVPVVGPLKQVLAELGECAGCATTAPPAHRRRGCASSRPGATSSRCATANGGAAEAAARARDAPGADRRPRRRRSGRRASASTRCGRCSTCSATGRARFITSGGLGTMGYGDPGRDRREGGAARRDRRLRRRRRLLPDDQPGAGDRGARGPADRRRDRQQRLPRAWSTSGRTCSSTSAGRTCI